MQICGDRQHLLHWERLRKVEVVDETLDTGIRIRKNGLLNEPGLIIQ